MCGINLIVDKKNTIGQEPIKKMTAATQHRGPQHSDILKIPAASNVYLGHNRLKIIDSEISANQPFVSECNRYFLIYNGEIFNFQELRNELLDKGISFKTYSDTEVLFHLLIIHGLSSLSLLDGMFSLIFYDKESGDILLARDENGIKPLYYYNDEQYFIASSETRGIFASGLASKKLNKNQIRHYLHFKFAKAPETFYEGVLHVMPGNYIIANGHSPLQIRSFKEDLKKDQHHHINTVEIVEKTEELLVDAISKQLFADVPAGIFASGGVDSTLLLALIKEHGLPMVPSFSIVHKKEEGSFGTKDFLYAKKAADQYQFYQYELEVGIDDLDLFDEFIHDMDQPIGDSAAFLTYKLAREAKKKVGVALSGAGADEVFGGYHRHHAFKWYLNNYKRIKSFSPIIKKLMPLIPSGLNHPFRKKSQLAQKFIRNITDSPGETFINFNTLNILPRLGTNTNELFKGPEKVDENLKAALLYDQENYLIYDILALTDQMSMRWGLEVRVPYLDKKLTQFVDKVPVEVLFSKGRKWILKELLLKYGGNAFVKRPKEGMGLPFGNWIRKSPNNEALKYLKGKLCIIYNYVSEDVILKLLKDHIRGNADNTLEIWSLVVLEAWLQKEFKSEL